VATYALRSAEPPRANELLLVAPLDEKSFSPHLVHGLLMYVLYTSRHTRQKLWPAFRRPALELRPSRDLRGRDYEELVDQLRALWGKRRVLLPPDLPVGPPPPTRLSTTARISHAVFWLALLASIVLAREPAPRFSPSQWPPWPRSRSYAAAVAARARPSVAHRKHHELSRRHAAAGQA
jgi:hypothetical protein